MFRVWSGTRARLVSDVEIFGFHAEVSQWVYAAGQAVAAGLVEQPEDWPGVHWLPEDIGRTLTAQRPDVLFSTRVREHDEDDAAARARLRDKRQSQSRDDKSRGRTRRRHKQLAKDRERRDRAEESQPSKPKSSLPEAVSYTVPIPKCLQEAGMDVEQARRYLREALDLYVAEVHRDRRERGLGFVGSEALRSQDPHTPPPGTHVDCDHPSTYEHIPRLATTGLTEEEVREVKDDLSQWISDYQEAREILLLAEAPHRARFPQGTHLRAQEMRRVRAAHRAQAPPKAA